MGLLNDIIDIAFSLARVGEAKLNGLKRCISNFMVSILLQVVAGLIGFVAILFFICAMFWALLDVLGGPLAALLTGGAVLLLAVLIFAVGMLKSR